MQPILGKGRASRLLAVVFGQPRTVIVLSCPMSLQPLTEEGSMQKPQA